jgi:hypothetical protein
MSIDFARLSVSLHDVAPATLDDSRDTLAFLDDLRVSPVALLVVPDYHGLGRADRVNHCATRNYVLALDSDLRIAAPSLVVSTQSRWRRGVSPLWNHGRLTRLSRSPVIRLALHVRIATRIQST